MFALDESDAGTSGCALAADGGLGKPAFLVAVRDDAYAFLVARRSALAFQAVASITFQAFNALQVWALAHWVGADIGFGAAAIALTLTTLAMLVPVSIGGFGVREGTYVVLLGSLGVSATDATLISIGTVFVLLLASLPGALLLILRGLDPVFDPSRP